MEAATYAIHKEQSKRLAALDYEMLEHRLLGKKQKALKAPCRISCICLSSKNEKMGRPISADSNRRRGGRFLASPYKKIIRNERSQKYERVQTGRARAKERKR